MQQIPTSSQAKMSMVKNSHSHDYSLHKLPSYLAIQIQKIMFAITLRSELFRIEDAGLRGDDWDRDQEQRSAAEQDPPLAVDELLWLD